MDSIVWMVDLLCLYFKSVSNAPGAAPFTQQSDINVNMCIGVCECVYLHASGSSGLYG